MSYLEELRQSRNKAQVAYTEFAYSTSKLPEHFFCFFEGKDNPYYIPRIKRFTDKYHPIKCGGRERVLEVYNLIKNHTEYDKYRKGFFIDRDFNEPLKPNYRPIFETPCYSIENLYVSADVFREILTNEFHLTEIGDKIIYEKCVSVYILRQIEFHQAVCLFNAWYACLIELKNMTGKKTGVNLDDNFPKDLIEITLDSVKSNYDLEKLKELFPSAIDIPEEMLNDKLLSFQNCEFHKIFRGKYEMQFLIKIIQLLLNDSISNKSILNSKINFSFGDGSGLNNQQAINIFTAYAETPDDLIKYLQEVIQLY